MVRFRGADARIRTRLCGLDQLGRPCPLGAHGYTLQPRPVLQKSRLAGILATARGLGGFAVILRRILSLESRRDELSAQLRPRCISVWTACGVSQADQAICRWH